MNQGPDKGVEGQVALVTGASSGLGRRFAQVLAAAGAHVVVAARRTEKLDSLVEDIKAADGDAVAVAMDVASAESFGDVLDHIEALRGTVTILVNNAGVSNGNKATRVSLDVIDNLLAVNVKAPFVLSREVAKRLIAADLPGRIVNIASMAAFHYTADARSSAYAVSKAATVRLTEVLAEEWASYQINVNAIAPGFFLSEMSQDYIDKVGEDFIQSFRRKRIGQPENLDSTLLYLVSEGSALVTGTCIKVDDGQMPR